MKGIMRLVRGVSMVGPVNAVRAMIYGRRRRMLDASNAVVRQGGPARIPGAIVRAETAPAGARFLFSGAELSVRFLSQDLLFMGWDGAESAPSWAVGADQWPGADCRLENDGDGWHLHGASLHVRVKDDGTVRIMDAAGRLIREDAPPAWSGSGWSQTAVLPDDAGLHGLGFRFGPFDLRRSEAGVREAGGTTAGGITVGGAHKDEPGRTYRFWNRDPSGYGPGDDPLYLCMPVYACVGDDGCHIAFHDTTFDGSVTAGQRIVVRFHGGPCRTYVAAGTLPRALELFTRLTGRAPLPPLWALGYQHSRWGFRTQEEMRRVHEGFRSRDLPLSALYLDIDQLRGRRTMTVDRRTHPDFAAWAEEIGRTGTRLVMITNPGVKKERGFPPYADGLREGVFCKLPGGGTATGVVWSGWSVFPDFTSERARRWWARLYAKPLTHGIRGFWHDMNEPASFLPSGDPTLPLCTRHDMDGRGGDHREAHNIYGLMMNRAGFEGLRTLDPGRRPFIVSRSGWVGMQKWSWTWSGDVETSWGALKRTVSAILGLGLCGMPYTGPDIGGFTDHPTPELYVRWFQLASFLPFFRTHSAIYLPPREPWSFGVEVLAVVRAALHTRMRMLPYWYTCAHETSGSGAPLVRPVFWDEPARAGLRTVDDEFLVGGDVLAAPVLEAGALSRAVVFPGGGWYPLEEGGMREGREECPAPLDVTPVYARAGAIVPLSGGKDDLELHAYAGRDGSRGRLFSDAGDGYGDWRLDDFRLTRSAGGAWALSRSTTGSFPWRYHRVSVVLHGYPQGTVVDDPGRIGFMVSHAPS